jgi:Zn-dependent protease with chaperone function
MEWSRTTYQIWDYGQPALCQDNPITLRVNTILQSLLPYTHRTNIHLRTVVINDPITINAYALPAGYVFITTGMLDLLGSRDELAFVLAHELGHINGKHGIRQVRDQERAANRQLWLGVLGQFVTTVADAAAGAYAQQGVHNAAAGARIEPNVAQLVVPLTEMGVSTAITLAEISLTEAAFRGYGLAREQQADRLGIIYVKSSGLYNPAAALTVIRRLEMLERLSGQGQEQAKRVHGYAATLNAHPPAKERLQRARIVVSQLDSTPAQEKNPDGNAPAALTKAVGPNQEGPEVLPVTTEDAWIAVSRLVMSLHGFSIQGIAAANRDEHKIKLNMAGDRYFPMTVSVQVKKAEPAGAEVTVWSEMQDHAWWPTEIMLQLKAELGLASYRCLENVFPDAKQTCEHCHHLKDSPDKVYECLVKSIPWAQKASVRAIGLLRYSVAEGFDSVGIRLATLPDANGQCCLQIRQGLMSGGTKQPERFVLNILKQNGYSFNKLE